MHIGGIVLAAFDQVPWELHDNSIILGCLSFFVALIMMYDLSDPVARLVTDMTQTDHDAQATANNSHATTTTTTSTISTTNHPPAVTNNLLSSHQSSHPADSMVYFLLHVSLIVCVCSFSIYLLKYFVNRCSS